jgi:hypothetical protein
MINSADAVDQHQLAFHEMPKPIIQALILGEPAVAAQIEFVAVMSERSSQPANVIVPFEHGNPNPARTQLVSSRQSSRACAENDDSFIIGYLISPCGDIW